MANTNAYTSAIWHLYDHEQIKEIGQDCKKLLLILANDEILENTIRAYHTRIEIEHIINIFSKQLSLTKNTTLLSKLINQKGDWFQLPHIIDEIFTKWHHSHNNIPATLTTAQPCHQTILQELAQKLTKIHNRTVTVQNIVQPKHIGGAILTINQTQVNFSYKELLNQLEQHLRQTLSLNKN